MIKLLSKFPKIKIRFDGNNETIGINDVTRSIILPKYGYFEYKIEFEKVLYFLTDDNKYRLAIYLKELRGTINKKEGNDWKTIKKFIIIKPYNFDYIMLRRKIKKIKNILKEIKDDINSIKNHFK